MFNLKKNRMKAEELRICNLVNVDGFTQNFTITEIKERTIRASYIRTDINQKHNSIIEIHRVKPIQLTEEWLLKFGFEEWDKNAWQKGFDLSIHKIDSIFWYNNNGINVLIKYVHQLQNLSFALTAEELTLKKYYEKRTR